MRDRDRLNAELLEAIKAKLNEIDRLLSHAQALEEDCVYRYYHQSFKVFYLNDFIQNSKDFFQNLINSHLNGDFTAIVDCALGKSFDDETNGKWDEETRPILEAFWHCKYFLEQMKIYGKELDSAPQILPSGWAAVLYLYNMR